MNPKLATVEFVFGLGERLVVFVLVLRDDPRKGQHRGDREVAVEVEGEQVASRPAIAVVERVDVFEQEVADDGPLKERHPVGTGEVDHLGQQCGDPRLAADSAVDRYAMRPLHLDVVFSEQFAVRLVIVRDLVERDLVVDRADVFERLRQLRVPVGEVEVEFREFAEPCLPRVAVLGGLSGGGDGGLGLLPGGPHSLHLVGGEQFLGYGVGDVAPLHDAGHGLPHGRHAAFGQQDPLREHGDPPWRGHEQLSQWRGDAGGEGGVRRQPLRGEPVMVFVCVAASVRMEQTGQGPVLGIHYVFALVLVILNYI